MNGDCRETWRYWTRGAGSVVLCPSWEPVRHTGPQAPFDLLD